jgi:site-specific DNA-methyltransferase (adenine-specific)
VTSPPYLRAVRYGKFNWIRLWLLGEAVEDVDRKVRVERTDLRLRLSDRLALPTYCDFIESTLRQCNAVLKPGGSCVLVIGDVKMPDGADLNLADVVWSRVKKNVNLKLEAAMVDEIKTSMKVTRIWGKRKGAATKRDRILLLRKSGGFRPRREHPTDILQNLRSWSSQA